VESLERRALLDGQTTVPTDELFGFGPAGQSSKYQENYQISGSTANTSGSATFTENIKQVYSADGTTTYQVTIPFSTGSVTQTFADTGNGIFFTGETFGVSAHGASLKVTVKGDVEVAPENLGYAPVSYSGDISVTFTASADGVRVGGKFTGTCDTSAQLDSFESVNEPAGSFPYAINWASSIDIQGDGVIDHENVGIQKNASYTTYSAVGNGIVQQEDNAYTKFDFYPADNAIRGDSLEPLIYGYHDVNETAYTTTQLISAKHTAPQFTNGDEAGLLVGSSGKVVIGVSGSPAVKLVDSGSTPLPKGLKLASAGNGKATIVGKPAVGTQGTYYLRLTASNGFLPSADEVFTLTIAPAATAAQLFSP